ncbi:hypothetical protein LguiB_021335 [Lonicera macranthoides]
MVEADHAVNFARDCSLWNAWMEGDDHEENTHSNIPISEELIFTDPKHRCNEGSNGSDDNEEVDVDDVEQGIAIIIEMWGRRRLAGGRGGGWGRRTKIVKSAIHSISFRLSLWIDTRTFELILQLDVPALGLTQRIILAESPLCALPFPDNVRISLYELANTPELGDAERKKFYLIVLLPIPMNFIWLGNDTLEEFVGSSNIYRYAVRRNGKHDYERRPAKNFVLSTSFLRNFLTRATKHINPSKRLATFIKRMYSRSMDNTTLPFFLSFCIPPSSKPRNTNRHQRRRKNREDRREA